MQCELQTRRVHHGSVAGHLVCLGLLLEPTRFFLVAEQRTAERAHEEGALVPHARRRHVRGHGVLHAFLQPARSLPVAEQLLELQARRDAVHPVMR